MKIRHILHNLALVAALSLGLQPAAAQTLYNGGSQQPNIGPRIQGVVDANGQPNPAIVPGVVALAGDGTPMASSGTAGQNVNITAVGGNTVTTSLPVSDAGGSLTTDTLQLPSTLGIKTSANSLSVTSASDAVWPSAQSGSWNVNVTGNVASSATDTGNPVKVGCVYNTTPTTLTNGQRGNCQIGPLGSFLMSVAGNASTAIADVLAQNNDTTPAGTSALSTASFLKLLGATNWERARTIANADGAGTGTLSTAVSPNSAPPSAITPAVDSLVNAKVLCTAACNVYDLTIVTGATAGYYYIFNSTSAPADGAVAAGNASGNYQDCGPVPATTRFRANSDIPDRYSVGATLVFSTTACGTLTKSATAVFLKGRAKQ